MKLSKSMKISLVSEQFNTTYSFDNYNITNSNYGTHFKGKKTKVELTILDIKDIKSFKNNSIMDGLIQYKFIMGDISIWIGIKEK